jgi:hypothetical protein
MKKQFNKGTADEGLVIGLLVIAVIASFFTANFHIPNSGQHTGYVTSVEQSGIIWKTWTAYIKTDPQSSQEDTYCVTDPKTVTALQSAETEKNSVTVNYSVPWMTWKWQCGYEQSTIQSIDSSAATSSVQPTLCQTVPFNSPTATETNYNKSISEDPFVQYVRTALNDFLTNGYATCASGTCESGLLNDVHYPDGANFELQNISSDYLKSKFIVISTDVAPMGGKSIVLMFKDKPDKVFYAWVYDYRDSSGHNQGFDLRGFLEYDLKSNGAPDIETTQKMFIDQLCNPNFGI